MSGGHDNSGLGDLMRQAEHLAATVGESSGLPRVHRSLAQILDQGQRLWERAGREPVEQTSYKAAVLLGAKGYDVPRITQKLDALSAAKTFEPLEPVREVDIQGFLKNERENALLTVIEETRKSTFERCESRHWEGLMSEWEREKQRILNALVTPGETSWDFLPQPESFLEQSTLGAGRSTMDSEEMAYAKQVYIYNERVLEGGVKPKLVQLFSEAAANMDDKGAMDLWEIVEHMCEVPASPGTRAAALRSSARYHALAVRHALSYLHSSYRRYMQNTVYDRLDAAALGGVPGTLALVKSFLRVRVPHAIPGVEHEASVDGQPVWPLLYYCLRCGDLQALLELTNKAGALLKEYDFDAVIREYVNSPDQRLPHQVEVRVQQLYNRTIHSRPDPFMRAVYCVIARCRVDEDFSELWSVTEDFLWMRLSQVTFPESGSSMESVGSDRLTLQGLQLHLTERYGEAHFTANGEAWLYPRLLLLTGQPETAVEYMSRIPALRAHGTHVALALNELGLLLTPAATTLPLLSQEPRDPPSLRRLNLPRLLTLYTKKFEATDPREALNYLFFLKDMKDKNGESLFTRAVTELVLETREFEMLLGKVEKSGLKKPGAVSKFISDTSRLVELVARDTEDRGMYEDAVALYDLAGKPDRVMRLLTGLVSQALSERSSNTQRLHELATVVAERYREQGVSVAGNVSSTFYLLLDLCTFFSHVEQGAPERALEIISRLNLLPKTPDAVEAKVKAFSSFTDELRRCMPDVLLATMNILHQRYKQLRSSLGVSSPAVNRSFSAYSNDGGSDAVIRELREHARGLLTFAGMLPYRLPGDTSARLVQLELAMN